MEAIKFNDKGYIDLGRARITPEIIEGLNDFQTGINHKDVLTDDDYTNDGIEAYCEGLDDLKQYMLDLYIWDMEDDTKLLMDFMVKIQGIKKAILKLKAPIQNEK